jgi:hypothetical protein
VNISPSPGVLWNNSAGYKMIITLRILLSDHPLCQFSNRILSTYVHLHPLLLSAHNTSNRQMSKTFHSFPLQRSSWVSIKGRQDILAHIYQNVMHLSLVIQNKFRWCTNNFLISILNIYFVVTFLPWGVILFCHLLWWNKISL